MRWTGADKDLYDAEKTVDAAVRSLEARKKLVDDAICTLDKCIAYRRAVMNSFAGALDKMRNEQESPEIKSVAESLVKKYERASRVTKSKSPPRPMPFGGADPINGNEASFYVAPDPGSYGTSFGIASGSGMAAATCASTATWLPMP